MSLRSRFFWATLGLLAGAFLVTLLGASWLVTPRVVERVVTLDEKARLAGLALELSRLEPAGKSAWLEQQQLRYIRLVPKPEGDELVAQPLPESSDWLVSRRPVDWQQARQALQPPLSRWLAALLLNGALLFALATLLSRFVTRPLDHLRKAVESVGEGRRGVSVEEPNEQELAQLAQAFNRMVAELEVRETRLRQTGLELEQALAAKDRIFANTSHELRTPLTAILGYVQLLRDGMKGPLTESQDACLEVIERNAGALLSQVEDLLTMSRLQSGHYPVHLESHDLRELVDEMVTDLRPSFERKGLSLQCDLPNQAVPVRIDFERGRRVLSNLLDNARKFTPQGEVRIEFTEVGLDVEDSGPGVQLSDEELFQAFRRGPDKEETEGAGLGLCLARELARAMGGELKLQRSGSDGSVFRWEIQGEPASHSKPDL